MVRLTNSWCEIQRLIAIPSQASICSPSHILMPFQYQYITGSLEDQVRSQVSMLRLQPLPVLTRVE